MEPDAVCIGLLGDIYCTCGMEHGDRIATYVVDMADSLMSVDLSSVSDEGL